jgi:dihydropteroate synthase
MGILNITPDSFYDGGLYQSENKILSQVEKMLNDGATFIDVGAYSSRPGADDIPVKEEINRLLPVLHLLKEEFKEDILISVDTFRSDVAEKAIHNGANIINDISAGKLDERMFEVIALHQVPYIMMHMKGTPQNMKDLCKYDDLVLEVRQYFSERLDIARKKGITNIIIDPGFGFAKNISQNFELLKNFQLLRDYDVPLLCGISRKSMIYKTLNTTPNEALNGTTVLNTIALQKGTNILRVHDVKEAVECIKLNKYLVN